LSDARIGLVVGLLMALTLAAFVFGPWVKMQLGIRPDVEISLVSAAKKDTVLFVTYRAHNKGDTGPVGLARIVRYGTQQWERRTLVMSFKAGETLEKTDEFRGVPGHLSAGAFDIELSTEPRWVPFRW